MGALNKIEKKQQNLISEHGGGVAGSGF